LCRLHVSFPDDPAVDEDGRTFEFTGDEPRGLAEYIEKAFDSDEE